jgi:hypothetical protein
MSPDEVDGTKFLYAIFDKAFEAGQDDVFVRHVQIEGEAYYKRYRNRVIGLVEAEPLANKNTANKPSSPTQGDSHATK